MKIMCKRCLDKVQTNIIGVYVYICKKYVKKYVKNYK